MKDSELLREFIRIERSDREIQVLVLDIGWDGPHTPVSTWKVARTLLSEASEADIGRCTSEILGDSKHFQVCGECGERNPLGWMHEDDLCQGCASDNHGVVY